MNEPLTLFPRAPAAQPRDDVRRSLRRRLMALLAAGGAAFVMTTWVLVRVENPLGPAAAGSSAMSVVKAHVEALNRGELRTAYALFSRRYREKVSFEAYHELVVTHWRMFRTRELRVSRDEESGERAVLETRMLAEGGEHYVARFALVRLEGRWWIDDLHWRGEQGPGNLMTA
jgi:hypothetical protein